MIPESWRWSRTPIKVYYWFYILFYGQLVDFGGDPKFCPFPVGRFR
jgi:hypothetical protein